VQPLLEYTATFGPAVTVPEEDTFWLAVKTATVIPATAMAATVKRITANFEALISAICFTPHILSSMY
jgi:hypothetical protein